MLRPQFPSHKRSAPFFDQLAQGESRDDALVTAQIDLVKSLRERDKAAHPFSGPLFASMDIRAVSSADLILECI